MKQGCWWQDWNAWDEWFITHPLDAKGAVIPFRTWGNCTAAHDQPVLQEHDKQEDERAFCLRVKRSTGPFNKTVVDAVQKSMVVARGWN